MEFIEVILHIDEYLASSIAFLGGWVYVLLFAVLFAETGLVITPFLPGDSLLFAVGALAGAGMMHIGVALVVMIVAAIIGDTVNYWIGSYIGPKVFVGDNARIFKKDYLEKTRVFYARYGGKTIIIARFLPIIRTFAPFVAGIGKMHYRTFVFYNVVGALIWVLSLTLAGFYLGGLPWVREHFEYAVLGIIAISLLPMAGEYIRYKRGPQRKESKESPITYTDIRSTFSDKDID